MKKIWAIYLACFLSTVQSVESLLIYAGQAIFDAPNKGQDSASIHTFMLDDKECTLAGVYDGHGYNGDIAAETAKDAIVYQVPDILSREDDPLDAVSDSLEAALSQAGLAIKNNDDLLRAGTTAVVACIVENMLHLANVGDSRAVIGYYDDDSNIVSDQPLLDHACDNKSEVTRACNAGGLLKIRGCFNHNMQNCSGSYNDWRCPYRKDGTCLYIQDIDNNGYCSRYTRSLEGGGHEHNGVVTGEPELYSIELSDAHRFIILASDGVWDEVLSPQISNQEAVEVVSQALDEHGHTNEGAAKAADRLACLARDRVASDAQDDISVVVIAFTHES